MLGISVKGTKNKHQGTSKLLNVQNLGEKMIMQSIYSAIEHTKLKSLCTLEEKFCQL